MIACIEGTWLHTIMSTNLYRYELPTTTFQPVDGDWTSVSGNIVEPTGVEHCGDLFGALSA